MVVKKSNYKVRVDARKIIDVLSDIGFVFSNLPYVTGRRKGNIVALRFSRFKIFKITDVYELKLSRHSSDLELILEGVHSRISIVLAPEGNIVKAVAKYEGPRGWIVSKFLPKIAESLIKAAEKEAEKQRVSLSVGQDYSRDLSKISWVTKFVMKAILLKSQVVNLSKGELLEYIEEMAAKDRVFEKYSVVYVSGESANGKFKLLFINGELKGVYVNLGGREFFGDETKINEFSGLTRIRVYGSLKPEAISTM